MQDPVNVHFPRMEKEGSLHKENLPAEALLKKQAEARAQQVVELLIGRNLESSAFFRCLDALNPARYEDVVDERAIVSLCGYPLCANQKSEMPKKKYFIYTKLNKVYDTTDRKKFCSNYCYKASNHIKEQIDDSPLYLRDKNSMKSYYLLDKAHSDLTPGKEVVCHVDDSSSNSNSNTVEEFVSNICNVDTSLMNSSLKLEQINLLTLSDRENDEEINHESIANESILKHEIQQDNNAHSSKRLEKPLEETVFHVDEAKMQRVIDKVAKEEEKRIKPVKLIDIIVNPPKYTQKYLDIIQKSSNDSKHSETLSKSWQNDKKMQQVMEKINLRMRQQNNAKKTILIESPVYPEREIKKLDTLQVVQSKKQPQMNVECISEFKINEIMQAFQSWLTIDTFRYLYGDNVMKKVDKSEKLDEICTKLQMMQMTDKRFGENDGLLPMPDYQQLQADARKMDLKVRAFYSRDANEKSKNTENERKAFADAFRNSVMKSVRNLVLEMLLDDIVSQRVQELLNTFEFSRRITTFNLAQRNLIAMVLISCLTKMDFMDRHVIPQSAQDYIRAYIAKATNSEEFLRQIHCLIDNEGDFIRELIENDYHDSKSEHLFHSEK